MLARTSADCRKMHLPPPRAVQTPATWRRTLTTFAQGRTSFSTWLSFLCLGLILLRGTVQAEHVHPTDPGSVDTHAACSLCVTAHVGVESAAAPLLHLAARVVGQAEPRPAHTAYPAPQHFDLYTRPPPTDPTRA